MKWWVEKVTVHRWYMIINEHDIYFHSMVFSLQLQVVIKVMLCHWRQSTLRCISYSQMHHESLFIFYVSFSISTFDLSAFRYNFKVWKICLNCWKATGGEKKKKRTEDTANPQYDSHVDGEWECLLWAFAFEIMVTIWLFVEVISNNGLKSIQRKCTDITITFLMRMSTVKLIKVTGKQHGWQKWRVNLREAGIIKLIKLISIYTHFFLINIWILLQM